MYTYKIFAMQVNNERVLIYVTCDTVSLTLFLLKYIQVTALKLLTHFS